MTAAASVATSNRYGRRQPLKYGLIPVVRLVHYERALAGKDVAQLRRARCAGHAKEAASCRCPLSSDDRGAFGLAGLSALNPSCSSLI